MGAPSGSETKLSGRSPVRVTINHAGGFGDLADQSLLRERVIVLAMGSFTNFIPRSSEKLPSRVSLNFASVSRLIRSSTSCLEAAAMPPSSTYRITRMPILISRHLSSSLCLNLSSRKKANSVRIRAWVRRKDRKGFGTSGDKSFQFGFATS
jgi:hypothetical protein